MQDSYYRRTLQHFGMFWRQLGAENALAFRCIHASRPWDTFWRDRLNASAAGRLLKPSAPEEICRAPVEKVVKTVDCQG